MVKRDLEVLLKESLVEIGVDAGDVLVERSDDTAHGDYVTNAAMVYAREAGKNPREIAEEIVRTIVRTMEKDGTAILARAEVAGPGFINFYVKDEVLARNISEILKKGDLYGKNDTLAGRRIMVEYTDPNPFKPFHIGHLMTNAIGESIARIMAFSGAEVRRANYQGDIGRHVAMALWGLRQKGYSGANIEENGEAYAYGNTAFTENETAKREIIAINTYLYKSFGSNRTLDALYTAGRDASLAHFDELYKKLGTTFDYSFFESETWKRGESIVDKNTGSVFKKSNGAIIFDGEQYGLHARVFINSEGLPTYEAKELGLAYAKHDSYEADGYLTVTAVEQKEYFSVVFKALELVESAFAGKFHVVTHGMMRFADSKMSSRMGNVVTGESLLREAEEMAKERMRENAVAVKQETAEMVAVAAVKYAILKQAIGKNIVYQPERALSFEGDSGPYLQYTYARAMSLLDKSDKNPFVNGEEAPGTTERILPHFPEVVLRAKKEYAPQYIATYLTELARAFNAFYAEEKIIGGAREEYLLAVAQATAQVIKNGLYLLGIASPRRM